MSQTTISASSQTQAESRARTSHVGSRKTFAQFDDRVAEVSERILPKQPYVITVPSDFPYRRHTTDPARWYLDTPFHRKEEQLQYMSLLLHQDDDEALLRLDGTRIDEDGRLLVQAPTPHSEVPSRPQTPAEAAPKKKITLKDYQSKDKSAVNTPERRPAEDIRKQALKSHKEEVDAKRQDQESQANRLAKAERPAVKAESPVPRTKINSKSSLETPTQRDQESQRPAKKRRLSAGESKTPTIRVNGMGNKPDPVEGKALPQLLSPDMPATEKKRKPRDLPALLSPKLPQALEKAAAAAPPPIQQRSDEVKSILKGMNSPARSDKKLESNPRDASPNRGRSESQLSAKSTISVAKGLSPLPKVSSVPSSKSHTNPPDTQAASPRPRQRHTIVLRYGKKNRKRVEMLLKFAPRPKKEVLPPAEKERPSLERPSSVKQPAKLDGPRLDKKRPAESLSETASKRPKLATTTLESVSKPERPTTPRPDTAGKSPSHLLKPPSAHSTPRKDPTRSTAMQRVASTDTTEVRTPSQETSRTSEPLTVTQSSQPKTSPAPTSNPAKSDEHSAWTELQGRIFQLGRTLKREGFKLASEGEGKSKQKGVVLLIEALLCFVLNSACQAQARPHADPGWSTITPYFNMVLKQSWPYKHLHGLVVQLGAVWKQCYHHENLKRLAKETLPEDHIGSAPTPGSDGNARSTDDNTKKQENFLKLRDDLLTNSKELRVAWLDGSKVLPYDVIEDQYPGTWSRRTKDFSKRNPDKLNPKELAKDFYLPLDVSTTVFEATNFALAFLNEWAMIEQVQWKPRIEL